MNTPLRARSLLMTRCTQSLASLVLLATLGGCAYSLQENRNVNWLLKTNPIESCNTAVGRGDRRFLTIPKFGGTVVPGTDEFGADKDLIAQYGTRPLVTTSAEDDIRIGQLADTFATTYNKRLLEQLRGGAPVR